MNPATRSLLERLSGTRPGAAAALEPFVVQWDALERLVIRVYKGKAAVDVDEAEHAETRRWLLARYPDWEPALRPHWQAAKVAGEPASRDPFALLLSVPTAAGFVGNSPALVSLPPAREALNRYILELLGD